MGMFYTLIKKADLKKTKHSANLSRRGQTLSADQYVPMRFHIDR